VDVGLARHIDRSDITALGGAPGTPGYKSPEQARGRRHLTVHSDWFSLGITLYHVATKCHPFNGQQHNIGVTNPVPMQDHRRNLPESFCRLVHDMLSIVPAKRPRSPGTRFQQLLET
jgi:serine/threonine protein kinase